MWETGDGRPAMNAQFFVLAIAAAVNPKFLAVDLLLVNNRRPRAMFLCVLLGGMAVAITIGLLDVLAVHPDAINSQKTVSAGVDLALGLLLLAFGGLLATGRVPRRHRAPGPAGSGQPEKAKKNSWAQRILTEPRYGLAVLVGAVGGLPGAAYLDVLHNLVAGKYSITTQVVAVLVFVIIEFLLVIVPFVLLVLRPEATKTAVSNAQIWLHSHAWQLVAGIALILGAYLTVNALVSLA